MEESKNTMPTDHQPPKQIDSMLEPKELKAFLQTLAVDKCAHIHFLEIVECQNSNNRFYYSVSAQICRGKDVSGIA